MSRLSNLTPAERSGILLQNLDKSDCGVIAFQAITGIERAEAVERMKAAGFDPKSGTPRGSMEVALERAGYDTEKQRAGYRDTPATFSLRNEFGLFLLYTERHVMALVEGDLYNSRGHWRLPLEQVTKVTRRS